MKKRVKRLVLPLAVVLMVVGILAGVAVYSIDGSVAESPLPPQDTPIKDVGVVGANKQVTKDDQKPSDFDITVLLNDTNKNRIENGLQPLGLNAKLNASALAKCNDMVVLNYWEHNRPDGTTPWHFFTESGYSYSGAGENLAYGFRDASSVVSGWMNSPKHKENILDTRFSEVGYGVCKSQDFREDGPEIIIVQHFGRPYSY